MTDTTAIADTRPGDLAEQVAIVGDLAQLTASQRMAYYSRVCESLGINPYTQPFQYIKLNNKLVLYATRTAADQLRRRNGVSLDAPHIEFTDGLVIVTVTGHDDAGRTDTEIGAVPLGNLQGEARANAIMKAVTKAKRRLTLSICGLGWLDETEVESIHDARPVTVSVDGEIIDSEAPRPAPKPAPRPAALGPLPDDELAISEASPSEFVTAVAALLATDTDTVKSRLKALGYTGVSKKPAERLTAYRALKVQHPPASEPAQDDLFGEMEPEPAQFVDPA